METGGVDSNQGSKNYSNRYMRDFRKMVTSHYTKNAHEETKDIPLNQEVEDMAVSKP